jgi:hypothetical protein
MMTIHRIADSKIAEDWVLVESLGLFQQLQLLPSTVELIRSNSFSQTDNGGR